MERVVADARNELDDAVKLAQHVLDNPYIVPARDICLLAKQLLSMAEQNIRLTDVVAYCKKVVP